MAGITVLGQDIKGKERNVYAVELIEFGILSKLIRRKEPVLDPVLEDKLRALFRDLERDDTIWCHDVFGRICRIDRGRTAERAAA